MMSSLTHQQLQFLEMALHARESNVRSQAYARMEERLDDPYNETGGRVGDVGDASVAKFLMDFDNSMIEFNVAELRAIDAAKERLAQGSYGDCIDCEQAIDFRRLAVYPIANRCIRCQALHEKTHAGARHATL